MKRTVWGHVTHVGKTVNRWHDELQEWEIEKDKLAIKKMKTEQAAIKTRGELQRVKEKYRKKTPSMFGRY